MYNKRTAMKQENVIQIKCAGARLESLKKLESVQGDLKSLSVKNAAKLKTRIETKGFDAPFFVWENKILDGTQRKRVLETMIAEGWVLPDGKVPVCDIEAANLDEAKDRLLGYVSQYGKVDAEGLRAFLEDLPDIDLETLDLPDFDMVAFELGEPEPDEDEGGAEAQIESQYTVVCDCKDESQQEEVFNLLKKKGYECRVMTLDAPI